MDWRSYWLAVGALLLPVCLHCQALDRTSQEPAQPPVLYTSTLGMKYCALRGDLGNQSTTLHIWIRLGPGPAHNSLQAAGFAVLESPKSIVPVQWTDQMTHGEALQFLSDNFYLRSLYSQQLYNLTVKIPHRANGRQVVMGDRIHVPIVFWANWTLHAVDTPNRDYELRVQGLPWYCSVMAAPAAAPFRQLPEGAMLQPLPPVVEKSSLGPATKAWVVLQPPRQISPTVFATLLRHHASWHQQLGVSGYLLYVQDMVHGLLNEPLVQEMMAQGRLHLIQLDEMGRYEEAPFQNQAHNKLQQGIFYSHAALATWGTDTLLFMPDVDEFLVTSRPMTLVEMFKRVAEQSNSVAAVMVTRRDTRCRDGAPPDCCLTGVIRRPKWMAIPPSDVETGRQPHPLSCLEMTKPKVETAHNWPKVIVDPNLTRAIVVHYATVVAGSIVAAADSNTTLLAHVASMHVIRPGYETDTDGMQMKGEGGIDWFWPAGKLQHAPALI